MILDKLIEKKDIYAYINFRKKELRSAMKRDIKRCAPKFRESVKQRFVGRTMELEQLERVIRRDIKAASKRTAVRLYTHEEVFGERK